MSVPGEELELVLLEVALYLSAILPQELGHWTACCSTSKLGGHTTTCVNLFIGFDLCHVSPQAVLVVLVYTVGEGVLQQPVG